MNVGNYVRREIGTAGPCKAYEVLDQNHYFHRTPGKEVRRKGPDGKFYKEWVNCYNEVSYSRLGIFVFTGPTGEHKIYHSDLARAKGHWEGFCEANKVAASPLKLASLRGSKFYS